MKIMAKENLKEIRMKKGFSTANLAEQVKMSQRGYWQAETRLNGVGTERSRLIADTLGVEFDEIFEIVER